jgi:UDP-glucuronate decarboxylase
MIEAFIRLMGSPDEFTGPVNLGNETEFTILELAELVVDLTNSRSQIIRRPLPADDPRQRKPDARLAQSVLDWRATTPLADGLRLTIDYFDGLLAEVGSPATTHG